MADKKVVAMPLTTDPNGLLHIVRSGIGFSESINLEQAIQSVVAWPTPVDLYAEVPFTNQIAVNVLHSWNRYASVMVLDTNWDEVECQVTHNANKLEFDVSFSALTSGTIVLRSASLAANYLEQPFSNTQLVTINHAFGRYPSITVLDATLTEVEASVEHPDRDTTIVSFPVNTTGIVVAQL